MNASERAQARVRWGDLLPRQLAFLTVYAECANIAMACRQLGIGRRTVYDWRVASPDFAAAFADADETATETLEAEAWRRAVHGTPKPMVSKGTIVCYVQEYSDTLMAILLAGRRPEKYSKQRLEHRGTVRLGLEEDLTQLSEEELVQWRALALKAQRPMKALGTGA